MARTRSTSKTTTKPAKSYKHPESESPMRPEIGTQAQFKKKLPPKKYRYDDSLSPVLEWDGQNPARERGEARIAKAEAELAEARKKLNGKPETKEAAGHVAAAQAAIRELKAMSKPFLNWAGKAERLSLDVPTLPLFIHERLSTKAILDTLKGHRFDRDQTTMFDLFGDPQHSITDQVLRAYEHKDKWVNRMILGDSLVVMNSLLRYESLGGQVQMIYIDPPYGVKFGSNFQPFVRKREVSHNDDEDMTREPEMVQAYRDTWEFGIHSYLTYLRDRLLLTRELLTASGSVFVQISDENQHSVRQVLDEVFGADNFCGVITVKKTTGAGSPSIGTEVLPATTDFLLWYARNIEQVKYRQLYLPRLGEGWVNYDYVREPDGTHRRMTGEERESWSSLPPGSSVYRRDNLTSASSVGEASAPFEYKGNFYYPGGGGWKTSKEGLKRLSQLERLEAYGKTLSYRRFASDFPWSRLTNLWDDTVTGGYAEQRFYVVQTNAKIVHRCILMATDPGDLVLDPTCGSGTTAYCAEQWGRRWITIDTSRVPLALARQRLLTATFPWYELKDEHRGPAAGFVYKRKQNNKKEEVGGIVPHITLKSIANNELPEEEVLVDRAEMDNKITRVTGPFCFEATIPTPMDWEETATKRAGNIEKEAEGTFVDRMIEILRKSPVLRLEGNRAITIKNIRPPAKTLSLSAEAFVDATAPGQKPTLEDAMQEAAEQNGKVLPLSSKLVAFVFGPENGAVNEGLVWQAAKEANAKNYTHLYVTGFAIQPNARELIEKCDEVVGIPATYVQATPDLMMGDLLKNMRSSQVFSVCGMPEAELRRVKPQSKDEPQKYEVELLGMDVFDPTTMEVLNRRGDEVPAWFLDTNYNGLCFHVSQAFFPKTGAWENLKKALRGDYEETVWDHLAGTVSAPFEAGEHGQVAVKVIDERGNELLIVKPMSEAAK
jgi:adenine-specific DNA-methyltransferase